MKPKKPISFLLSVVLIVSMLVAVGSSPAISNAVTNTSMSVQTDVATLNTQLIQMLIEMIRQLQAQLQQLIAAKNNPTIPPSSATIQCGWCGNSCVNKASTSMANVYCADVMPPTGSYCRNIDEKCQITTDSTTVTTKQPIKYSCSTVMGTVATNMYSTCVPSSNGTFNSLTECQNSCPVTINACITEGNSISVTPTGFTQNCCSGLTLCPPPAGIVGSRGTCQKTCPVPELWVTISGLTYPIINQPSTYIANVIGGDYPYSYVWSTDGLVSSYSDSNVGNYKWTQPGLHTINVKVTDSKGVTGTGNLTITINPTSTITCTDTDGGDAMYQKGTTTIRTAAGGQWNYTDYCQSSTALYEYNCLSNLSNYTDSNAANAYMLTYRTCPSGYSCTDGACKPATSGLTANLTGTGCYNNSVTVSVAPNGGSGVYLWYEFYVDGVVKTASDNNYYTFTGLSNSNHTFYATVKDSAYTIATSTTVTATCTGTGSAVQGAETHIFEIDLGYAMENDEVKELQLVLTAKGYFVGTISGYFGWQTEEAVKAFQLANNLPATGFVGPLTRELLNK